MKQPTEHCVMCNQPLDNSHLFNIHCAAANAQNDQVMAEIEEATGLSWSDEDTAMVERIRERVFDQIAYIRFVQRNVKP